MSGWVWFGIAVVMTCAIIVSMSGDDFDGMA
jgi:hypothetical protein